MADLWSIPEIWPGETVVIMASGPSLDLTQVRHVALARLEERCRVIAVNDAIFVAWWADWLHACDFKWWNWHRATVTKFAGFKTTLTETVPKEWSVRLLRTAPIDRETGDTVGFPDEPDMVAGGGNGANQAIQIAVKAGAKRVILLGVDMKTGAGDKSHYFGDHEDGMRSDYKGTMLPYFETLIGPLKNRGVEIVNCSPGSALTCFPMARLGETL